MATSLSVPFPPDARTENVVNGSSRGSNRERDFYETGTQDGGHICRVAREKDYRNLYSIDINAARAALVQERCGELHPRVRGVAGDSATELARLLEESRNKDGGAPADFFLDAHADVIPGPEREGFDLASPGRSYALDGVQEDTQALMPLLRECEAIAAYNLHSGGCRVTVDDVRCWKEDGEGCPTHELWRAAGITTESILAKFDGQIARWTEDRKEDRLSIQLT